jgi:hypothetical protein
MNKTKYIKNLEDLEMLINTAKNYIITVNSNIHFYIDVVNLSIFSFNVKGDIKAIKINVYNLDAYNITACTINSWGNVKANHIDLIGCLMSKNIDAYSICAGAIKAEGYIKANKIKAEISVKANNLKIGSCKTNNNIQQRS